MPLIIPERTAVVRTLQSYVRISLPELDPSVTTRRGFIGGLVKSVGDALHDWYAALKRYADKEPFPQTATGGFLREGWWRDITKLDPNPAAPARGRVVITGTSGSGVVAGQVMTAGNVAFTVDRSAPVVTQSLVASSLTRIDDVAVYETSEPHNLASGMLLTFAGAGEAAYNVTALITVTAANEFTYPVSGAPLTPASGLVTVTGSWANTDVTATTTGQSTNVDSGGTLAVSGATGGLSSTARVTFGALGGGSEIETEDSYRARILEALGSDFGTYTGDEIEIIAKTVPGVTRVFVRKATLDGTNGVLEGQTRVAFLRDNDANAIPSSSEVSTVKALLLATTVPAHTAPEDLIVESPVRRDIDYTFTALSPDTASMRRAVLASLDQFFAEGVTYATDIPMDGYRCAIFETYDMEARVKLNSFTLATPLDDVAVGLNEMPFRGFISWPS